MRRIIVKTKLIFILLLILPKSAFFSQTDPVVYPGKLWNEIKKTDSDSLKIEKLFDLAFFYFDYMADDPLADSVSQIALRIAEMSHLPELLLRAYYRYIESNNLHENYQKSLDYAVKAEQISFINNNPEISFRNYKNFVSVYLSVYDYDKALEYSYKSLSIAVTAENNIWKAGS